MKVGERTLKRGFLWLGSASLFARLIDLAAIVVVLGFMSAEDVGAASAAWTVTALTEPLAGLGAGWALVTVPRLDRRALDHAWWVALFGSVLVAIAVVVLSPWLSLAFGSASLAPLIAVGALKLVPMGVSAFPQQRLARGLRHREIAAANAVATVIAALVRVGFAVFGFGPWAFVIAQDLHALALLTALWLILPHRPRQRLELARVRDVLGWGMPSSLSAAIVQWARNLDYVFVASFLGLHALGLYRVAFDLAMEPVGAIGDVMARSATPTLRQLARRSDRLASTFSYAVRTSLLVSAPIAVGTFVLAPTLLRMTKDVTFVTAASATRWLVVAALLRVVLGLYTPLAQALGRPALALRTSIEMFVLLGVSLFVCIETLSSTISIASAGVAWCVALLATLAITRLRFRELAFSTAVS